jgi:hypothetical protein
MMKFFKLIGDICKYSVYKGGVWMAKSRKNLICGVAVTFLVLGILLAASAPVYAGGSNVLFGNLLPSGDQTPGTSKMWITIRSGDSGSGDWGYPNGPYTYYGGDDSEDVGNFSPSWVVGEIVVAVTNKETGTGTTTHEGFYTVTNITLQNLSMQQFSDVTLRSIPQPIATGLAGNTSVTWEAAVDGGSSNIVGYNVYRSTDGINFGSALNGATPVSGTSYTDTTTVAGNTYYYAIKIVYRGSPNTTESACLSKNSAAYTAVAAAPTVTLSQPNGGESLRGGQSYNITWEASGTINHFNLKYSTDGGTTYPNTITDSASGTSYTWNPVPSISSQEVRVRIEAHNAGHTVLASDESNANFTIDSISPTVMVTSPNGGETWAGGSSHNITWTASDNIGLAANPITLAYSTDGGNTYATIASGLSNSGSYSWSLPTVNYSQVKVRASAQDAVGNVASDESNANFKITKLSDDFENYTGTDAGTNPLVDTAGGFWGSFEAKSGMGPLTLDTSNAHGGTQCLKQGANWSLATQTSDLWVGSYKNFGTTDISAYNGGKVVVWAKINQVDDLAKLKVELTTGTYPNDTCWSAATANQWVLGTSYASYEITLVESNFTVTRGTATFAQTLQNLTGYDLVFARSALTVQNNIVYVDDISLSMAAAPTVTGIAPSSGPSPNTIVINGTNLLGATSVTVNGVSVTFTPSVNNTTITNVAVQSGLVIGNSYRVVVINPVGASPSNAPNDLYTVSGNVAPNIPSGLTQYKSNGTTVIPQGAWTNENSVILRMSMSDPNNPDTLTPQVEVQAVGTPFTGNPTDTGTGVAYSGSAVTGSITKSGLTTNTSYNWQGRVGDTALATSSMVEYNAGTPDFRIDTTVPTNPTATETGGAVNNTWQRTVSDPNFNFSGATDTGGSGVHGYSVYWGIDPAGDPGAVETQTVATYNPAAVLSGSTYYLRARTFDSANLGGAANPSATATIFTFRYDATAPVVQLPVSPAPLATGQSLTVPISATFTETGSGVDPASVIAGNFTVVGSSSEAHVTAPTLAGNTVTFNQTGAFTDGETVTCTITTGLRDIALNNLASQYQWTFTVSSGNNDMFIYEKAGGIMMAYPNPFDPNDKANPLKMLFNTATGEAVDIYIFDTNARIIYQSRDNQLEADRKAEWDGETSYGEVVENGLYLIRIVKDGKLVAKGKILVIKK